MKIITKPLIEQTVKQMHDIVLSIFPKWHTVFSGEIGYFESKYTVAEATKNGGINFNIAFLGSDWDTHSKRLIKTIVHELAHLVVGNHHNHDKFFKRVEDILCLAVNIENTKTESGELKSMGVKFKYTLTSYYKYLDGSDLVESINFSRMTKKQQTMLDHPEKIICKDRYGATLKLIRSDLTINY